MKEAGQTCSNIERSLLGFANLCKEQEGYRHGIAYRCWIIDCYWISGSALG